MKYETLRVYSYNHPTDIEAEYARRLESQSTSITSLQIYPNEHDHKALVSFPLFFMTTPRIMLLATSVMQKSGRITNLMNQLPTVASEQFFYNTLANEIKSTNQIEGVRSTREEAYDAIISALMSDKRGSRFHSLAYMYLGIRQGKSIHINEAKDIRKIWEDVTRGEVKKKDFPDGTLFRNSHVGIADADTGNLIHWPFSDEDSIVRDIDKLVDFMNDDDVFFIAKALVSHFYFEYIHPFFDGNGRTGRYLACAYLGKKLDFLTGVNLSYSINKNKQKYYKAFQDVEDPKNHGDTTAFIETMLTIITDGQDGIISELIKSEQKLKSWDKSLSTLDFSLQEKHVLFLLIQSHLFGRGIYSTLDDNMIIDIGNRSGFSKASIKRSVDALETSGYTELTKERPKIHRLTEKTVQMIKNAAE